jgi:chromosome segregation ATPase
VVLSMLLTAGVVVFVNRVDEYKKIVANEQAISALAKRNAEIASVNESSAKENLNQLQTQLGAQTAAAKTDRDKAAQDLLAKNTELAVAQQQLAIAMAANSQQALALSAAQTAQNQLNTNVTELRASVDKLQQQKLELDQVVADLTNQRDILENQRRGLAERVSMIETDFKRAEGLLKQNNIRFGPGVIIDPPPINGVVREVRTIEQKKYATISVGSADAVVSGMKFRVIDRNNGDFLGHLTVESVEANEASGRLDGPQVNRVSRGSEVRTQL